ncbi:MAG: DNA repair protein RecO [Bacteroidales bacterium]
MFEKTKGIVLNTVEFSDKGSIVHIYTEQYGKLAFTLPASRSKKATLKRNLFQPLTILELEIDLRPGRSVQKIKEARPGETYTSLTYHPVKSAVGLFLLEVLVRFIQEHEANPGLYSYLENSLLILDLSEEGTANFHLIFLYQLLIHLGLSPKVDNQAKGFFVLESGEVEPVKPSSGAFLNEEQTALLVYISNFSFRQMSDVSLNRLQRNMLTDALLTYLKYHFNNHIVLKSFDVLRALFE